MKETTSAKIDAEIKRKIEKEAKKTDRSVSYVINERLKKAYNRG
jgi:predicted transcriptional regulator